MKALVCIGDFEAMRHTATLLLTCVMALAASTAIAREETQIELPPQKANRPKDDDGPGGKYDGTFVQDYEYVKGSGDLDECNGRTGVTPEFTNGTYYYVVTDAYPFIPRLFRGTPDSSFE